MLNLEYIFSKFDYFYYMFAFLLIFIILTHTQIFNYNNLIPLVFTTIITYFLIRKYYYIELNNLYKENQTYSKIDYSKYTNLNADDSIIVTVIELELFLKMNPFEYRKLLRLLDNFFSMYTKLKLNPNNNDYDILFHNSKKILNTINSFGVNINYSDDIDLDKLFHIENKVKELLSKYLTEIEILINNIWMSDNITSQNKPIYPDDVQGLSHNSSNYNLY